MKKKEKYIYYYYQEWWREFKKEKTTELISNIFYHSSSPFFRYKALKAFRAASLIAASFDHTSFKTSLIPDSDPLIELLAMAIINSMASKMSVWVVEYNKA